MTQQVKLNEAVATLSAILNLLTKPFQVTGSDDLMQPDLCVTVLVYCGGNHSGSRKPVQVLLQGMYLKSSNCADITEKITADIKELENTLSRDPSKYYHGRYIQEQEPTGSDASMEGLIKAGTLALQLLPRNALKGIIIVTDGVLGFTSPSNMHNAVNQMRGANTSCWVVQVGGRSEPSAAFGLMPDSETLQFMSLACNGCVIQPEKVISAAKKVIPGPLNILQEAVLLWSFQQTAHARRVRGVVDEGWSAGRGDEEEVNFSPTIYKQFDKNVIHAPLFRVIGCRIRDGFFLKAVNVRDQDSTVEVTMCYPWQASVNIYYTIQAPWPVSESSTALTTTIAYDGPYSFVHDIHCNLNQPIISYFRATAVRKFKQVLKSQSYSDTFLAHFLSFSATPTYHTLPQKIQDGMPLFHLPPNQAKPVPAVGLSSSGDKKKKESALVNFWSPLCTIDTNLWYRWFHTDKIILILDHDTYLPRNLLTPSANHRFASVQCRIAASKLFNYLKTWCSFILLENQSFIRFLPTNESPRYFSLIRVAQKHPCVVLHVGHIEGTPHSLQSETLKELQEALLALSVERAQLSKRSRSSASQKSKTAKPCAFLVGKQLQRVMIRYDTSGTPFQSTTLSLVQTGMETERLVQNDYLTSIAWQWVVPHSLPTLLTALLRHRLKEGFRIARAQSGVVTLTAQLTVSQPHSSRDLAMLLQYVIFPLATNPSTSTSFSSITVAGGYPTCELWVEPQYGTVTHTPAGLHYTQGCTYDQIADKIHERDLELMLTVSSFIYLHHMCVRGCHSLPRAPLEEDVDQSCEGNTACITSSVPQTVPVPFHVSRLLPHCRVIALTLDGFPEVTAERSLTFIHASLLNTLFWQQIFEKIRELAPTEVALRSPTTSPSTATESPHPSPLLERLVSSEQLKELCRLCGIDRNMTDMGWKCFAMTPTDEENTICMLLIPNTLSREPTTMESALETDNVMKNCDGEEKEGDELREEIIISPPPAVFFLPLLLLHCDQEIILDPDPATPNPPSLLPDIFQRLTLQTPQSPPSPLSPSSFPPTVPHLSIDNTTSEPPEPLQNLYSSLANETLCMLVSKIRALHFSSYLHALQTTLTRRYPVPPDGFQSAVNICTRSTLSIDCTPLVGALCRHSSIKHISLPTTIVGTNTSGKSPETDAVSKQYITLSSLEKDTFGRQYSTSSAGTDHRQSDKSTGDTISKQSSTSSNLETEISSWKSVTSGSLNKETLEQQHLQFGPQMLSHLIRTVSTLSSNPTTQSLSSYRLKYKEESDEELERVGDSSHIPHCTQWEDEPQQLFQKYLSEAGFEGVPHCHGYYWLRGENDLISEYLQEEKKPDREDVDEGQKEMDERETHGGGEGVGSGPSPPSEASTIKRKHSITIDSTLKTAQSDHDSVSTGDDIDMAALSPLFSPSEPHFLESSRGQPSLPTAPLFLQVACCIQEYSEEDEPSSKGCATVPTQPPCIPVCMKTILLPACTSSTDAPTSSVSYSVFLTLSFLSFSPDKITQDATTTTNTDQNSSAVSNTLSSLPLEYHSKATNIRQRVVWMLTDELISISRECSIITPPLLQAMATHVHTSHHISSCFEQRLPIKFVFGPQMSMIHLVTEMEMVQISGYELEKCGEYYYLKQSTLAQSSMPNTPDIDQPSEATNSIFKSCSVPRFIRSTTPDSGAPRPSLQRGHGHRRSTSASVFPSRVTPLLLQGNIRNDRRGSIDYPPPSDPYPNLVQADSSYDASRSSSCSELSVQPPDSTPAPLDTPPFWLAIRVLQEEIQLYFHIRHSVPDLEGCLVKLRPLINQLSEKAREACHRANQLLLLRDMLETRQCSPLLFPESPSEAWVENVVHKRMPSLMEGGVSGTEAFSPQEFQCPLQWSKHITPHYRLKMNIHKALQITRVALDAFSVTNRKDVYVFQDVQENAAESIFYLKIDESLCRVDDNLDTDDSAIVPYDRCDTRATEAETLSTTSYHPSISEHDPDRQSLAESLFDQPGKPRESLVLQLYGINKPSQSLLERLTHRIIFKLDDAALEIMCGLYARNQKLKLTPSDVQFLQPPGSNPSRQLRILIPSWVREVHALFFYFLQSLSTLALKPKYTSMESHIQFQVPQSLQNACLTAGLSSDVHQDHIFLYIRPHTRGRGMAVFSVCLTDSNSQLVAPQPIEVLPHEGGWNPANLELTHSVCAEGSESVLVDDQEIPQSHGYILRIDIWEKGNVGITDLSGKLHLSLKQALCDYILELYFLPQPIARIDEMIPLDDSSVPNSPFVVLEPSTTELYRQESTELNPDSPRRILFEKGEIHVPSSLGLLSQRSQDSTVTLSPDTPIQSEPHRSRCDTMTVTHAMDDVLQSLETAERRDSIVEQQSEASTSFLTWQERELNRREMEALDAYQREAHHGKQGALEKTYSSLIPQHLTEMFKLSSRSVTQYSFPLIGSYSAEVFLNEIMAIFGNLCNDLSLSTFKLCSNGVYAHYTLQKTSRPRITAEVSEMEFIVVGRNLKQWDEARSLDVIEIRLTQPWIDAQTKQSLQLFHPLDSKKISKAVDYPLMSLAKDKPCFIPRQRLFLLTISNNMAQLWLYNVSEELVVRVRNRFERLSKWQQMRVGFLHHLLAQKMGLFQHTHAQDLHECTSAASKHCSSLQDTILLYRNPAPASTSSSQRQQRPQPIPTLESLYLEAVPTGHTLQTMDPVYNHGHQVKESHFHFRKTYESKDLLGKVFTSWPSHTGSAAVPVDSSLIRQLKRLARLLHFCSCHLLLSPPTITSSDRAVWFDKIRNEFLTLYIEYLKTLDFEEITERPILAPPLSKHKGGGGSGARTPIKSSQPSQQNPAPPQKFYKCMQRSWMHGIILIELTFIDERFDVKLLTLESSRLSEQKPLSPEVYGKFSTECARFKDLTHLNSFMHDFHLHLVLDMLSGVRKIPEWLDMKAFLSRFTREKILPATAFNRNRLERGQITVPLSSVKPAQLYHHILAHCDVFGMQTLELRSNNGSSGSSEMTVDDICLHINVSPNSLGPTTSPQLSKLLQDAQESYAIHIIAMREDTSPHCLSLAFYLLLVNINERFPRLTCNLLPHSSDATSTQYPLQPAKSGISPEESTIHDQESELHMSMRKRRLKLGLDPLHRSTASRLISDGKLVHEHMQSLQGHFEGIVKNAMHHMRRDELWKRMLYGKYRSEPNKAGVTQASFEQLRCDEFRELLRLVTYCPLEKLDPRLTHLRKQTKKWFKRLMVMMEARFLDNVRVYKTENENCYFTVVINPDWADMVVMAQSDRDGKSQGLYSVYRKPTEGSAVPHDQRPITAHVEADRQHIENIVNFCCCYLWASMLDSNPPQPHINLL